MKNFKFVFIALMALCFVQCKKKSSDPAPAPVVVPPTVYYAKYTLRDSSYKFSTSKNVLSSFGTGQVGSRIYLESDFYNDFRIDFIEKTQDVQLTYSILKSLEKTSIPFQSFDASIESGICVSITYANPNESYFTDNVALADQNGSFYIESVNLLPSTKFSPNTKRCEIKGRFNCMMNGSGGINYELTNGTFYLPYEFWPE